MPDMVLIQALLSMVLATLTSKIPDSIAGYLSSVVQQLPSLAQDGEDILAYFQTQTTLVQQMIAEDRDPTDAEWAALDAQESAEMAKLRSQATPEAST